MISSKPYQLYFRDIFCVLLFPCSFFILFILVHSPFPYFLAVFVVFHSVSVHALSKKLLHWVGVFFIAVEFFFCQIIILAKILHNKISDRQQIHNNINYFSVFFFFSFHLLSKRNNVENFREAVFECHHQMKRKGIATSLNTHFVDFIRPRNWFKYVQSIILSSFFVKFDLQGMNECCGWHNFAAFALNNFELHTFVFK